MEEEIRPTQTPQTQDPETPEEGKDSGGNGAMTFDQWLDSNPAFRSEFDRRATKAVNTARANWEKEQADSQDEAKKLAKMTEAQRERYQLEKDKEEFAARQAAFAHQQLEVQVGQDLQKRGLAAGFARFLTGKDAEESAANLDAFQELWNAGITAAVTDRMRGSQPPKDPERPAQITRAQLSSMTPAQIVEAYQKGELNDLLKGSK